MITWNFLKLLSVYLPCQCILCDEKSTGSVSLCHVCKRDCLAMQFKGIENLSLLPAIKKTMVHSSLDAIYCCYKYQWPFNQWISAYKYKQDLVAEKILLSLFAEVSNEFDLHVDAFILVPCHARRHFERGFNQLTSFARIIKKNLALPDLSFIVERQANTPHQAGLSAKQRRLNIKGAFSISKKRQSDLLKGKHILIFDDVVTTGSTLNHLATCLKKAGATKVSALAFAWAPLELTGSL